MYHTTDGQSVEENQVEQPATASTSKQKQALLTLEDPLDFLVMHAGKASRQQLPKS
jgi:hypothetical protein